MIAGSSARSANGRGVPGGRPAGTRSTGFAVVVPVVLQPPAEDLRAAVGEHRRDRGRVNRDRCAPRPRSPSAAGADRATEPAAAPGAAAGGRRHRSRRCVLGPGGGCRACSTASRSPAPSARAAASARGNRAWYPYSTRNERNTARRTRFSMNFRLEAAEPDRTRDHRMDDTARAAATPSHTPRSGAVLTNCVGHVGRAGRGEATGPSEQGRQQQLVAAQHDQRGTGGHPGVRTAVVSGAPGGPRSSHNQTQWQRRSVEECRARHHHDVQARRVRVLPKYFPHQALRTVADDGAAQFLAWRQSRAASGRRVRGSTNTVINRPCSRAPVSYTCWNSGRRRIWLPARKR